MNGMGSRIREARVHQGWVRYKDADAATGISLDNWANWETERTRPDAENLVRLCSTLHVTADWLLGLSDLGGPAGRERAMPSGEPPPGEAMTSEARRRALRGTRSSTRSTRRRPG